MYVSPSLRPLTQLLIARLPGCAHPWGPALAWVLRTRLILEFPLPRSTAGFTNPLVPVILVDRRLARRLAAESAPPAARAGLVPPAGGNAAPASAGIACDAAGRIADPSVCLVAQLLLHEAAHQLLAVWPEWRRWLGLKRIYGPSINAADAIAESIARELCAHTRYPGHDIAYSSPLRFLGTRFRR